MYFWLARLMAAGLVGRVVSRGLLRLLVFVGFVTLGLFLLSGRVARGAPSSDLEVWAQAQLAVELGECPPGPTARGLFWKEDQLVRLPLDLPAGAQLVLAGDALGRAALRTDDRVVVVIESSAAAPRRLELDFRQGERGRIVSLPPVPLAPASPGDVVRVQLEWWDMEPPTCSSSAYWLVVLAELPGATSSIPRSELSADTNVPESAPVPEADPAVSDSIGSPEPSPRVDPPPATDTGWLVLGVLGGLLLVLVLRRQFGHQIDARIMAVARGAGTPPPHV